MKTKQYGWIGLIVLATAVSGCHRGAFYRGGMVADPALVTTEPGVIISDVPERVTFVDRHPLLRKPVEYYHEKCGSTFCKLATATFLGVPVGILGEARQIIVGCPPGF